MCGGSAWVPRGDVRCRLCPEGVLESGDHLVFDCVSLRANRGWEWSGWEELDDRARWAYEYEEGGRTMIGDRVEDFFALLDGDLSGVG